jgi:hypothetical protein
VTEPPLQPSHLSVCTKVGIKTSRVAFRRVSLQAARPVTAADLCA